MTVIQETCQFDDSLVVLSHNEFMWSRQYMWNFSYLLIHMFISITCIVIWQGNEIASKDASFRILPMFDSSREFDGKLINSAIMEKLILRKLLHSTLMRHLVRKKNKKSLRQVRVCKSRGAIFKNIRFQNVRKCIRFIIHCVCVISPNEKWHLNFV